MRTIAITLVGLACLLLMGITNRKIEKRVIYKCSPAFARVKVISDSIKPLSNDKKKIGPGVTEIKYVLDEARVNKAGKGDTGLFKGRLGY